MAWALFLVIACLWAVCILPPLWADRRTSWLGPNRRAARLTEQPEQAGRAPRDTYHSSAPGPVAPVEAVASGMASAAILSRRRQAVVTLATAAIGTLVAAVIFRSLWIIGSHLAFDALLIWYMAMLRQIKDRQRAAELESMASEQETEMMFYSSRVRVVQSR